MKKTTITVTAILRDIGTKKEISRLTFSTDKKSGLITQARKKFLETSTHCRYKRHFIEIV